MTITLYQGLISEVLKTTDHEVVDAVEEQMRNQCGGVLDHLDVHSFRRECRKAYEVVKATCPLDRDTILEALISGKFRKMNEMDYRAFSGMEYEGWIWEVDRHEPGSPVTVVADRGPNHIHVSVVHEPGGIETPFHIVLQLV